MKWGNKNAQNTNSLEEKLNKFIEKNVIIIQDGFLKNKYLINKLKYSIGYEILYIADKESKNYLKINLNQIYKMEINEKYIRLYLDNDTIIIIAI